MMACKRSFFAREPERITTFRIGMFPMRRAVFVSGRLLP